MEKFMFCAVDYPIQQLYFSQYFQSVNFVKKEYGNLYDLPKVADPVKYQLKVYYLKVTNVISFLASLMGQVPVPKKRCKYVHQYQTF